MGDAGARAGVGAPSMDAALPLLGDEERESAVASMEDQWQQEMNVYEVIFYYFSVIMFVLNDEFAMKF
jgi:hypothetical protein